MKNIKYYIGLFLSFAFLLTSCQEDDVSIGEIMAPTAVTISAEIVGVDTDNPYGDGSGVVVFTATADNEITYQFDFGDGKTGVAPSGITEHRFTTTGINTYTVVVNAVGTGGVKSSTAMDVEVFSSFSDVEAENLMAGELVGDSRTWYWAANIPLHVGLGPIEDDYGNGEFAYEAWWNAIQPWDEEKYCMYTNEFVFTRTSEGLTFEQTVGPAFVPGAYADELGIAGDTCYDETVATGMFGVKNVSFLPSTSKAALEGSYNDMPYRGTAFEISDGGFMGWYVGASSYDIISVTENTLHVRIIQPGFGAWYQVFTSSKPVEGEVDFESEFNDLVWSDEFDTSGAPDAANWTYDLGAGGWGNQEVQTYTNDANNVIVEDGILKIKVLKEGNTYTSARLKSQGLQSFKYGRIEAKAKLPAAQGTWPAIWMLGSNFESVGWPLCGEIDIMEQTGWDKNTSLGTFHWFESSTNANASYGETLAVSEMTSEFHLYTLEWSEEHLIILVDNVQVVKLDNSEALPFYDKNFFMILNVAMGGSLGGDIDPDFTTDSMEIDYVRVYQ
ncbi:endo-13-beta-glucanase (GH16) [Formosa agariphila KMM 3901]|uniref:Endo-13-beta-glucanase (GH16) n=1 Tax=Formosa agariphila (strain DSM 15362 / KCTC 12365 / LMG 23005 / KMM 3901 / M-2Alg 35-1) TaxID=1347342 RepID=T2KMB6_FORAG|nr:glycoside hydrolase family 16 protein [Formosa agariphila]CDF79586.1 endo-13-beta-glucanase (GH16) [Formosa agariphila KMM 3901]